MSLPTTGVAWLMSRTTATGIRLAPPTLRFVGQRDPARPRQVHLSPSMRSACRLGTNQSGPGIMEIPRYDLGTQAEAPNRLNEEEREVST